MSDGKITITPQGRLAPTCGALLCVNPLHLPEPGSGAVHLAQASIIACDVGEEAVSENAPPHPTGGLHVFCLLCFLAMVVLHFHAAPPLLCGRA